MKTITLIFLSLSLLATVIGQECVPEAQRIDCHPNSLNGEGASEETCLERGCLWCTAEVGTPWCHLPSSYGYKMSGEPELLPHGYRVLLTRATNISYVGGDAQDLIATFEVQSDERLRIKITDGTDRFEVPMKINAPLLESSDPLYQIEFSNEPVFSFQIIRKATGTVLFDTGLGGLTFADQFIQLGIKIPSLNAYGIGENEQHSYRHDFSKHRSFPLFARDNGPDGDTNLYGVHPYYTVVEDDGNAHSVVIVNSNAQEFVLTPNPGYVYRTIGGLLDMYIFLGPTPEDTVRQFTQAIGRQHIPPYWSLGFQLCRWGYDNIANMKAAVDRTRAANIPQDIQYGDIDIMDRELDFTFDPVEFATLPEYIKELKADGIKFVPIVDPGIKFNETDQPALFLGDEADVWIKRPDGTPTIGAVWPGRTYFPDFSKNSTKNWWKVLLKDYKDLIDYDGIWIDMNEPANWGIGDLEVGCANNTLNYPPYVPAIKDGVLAAQTLCPDSQQEYGVHYNTHSLYGWSESQATIEAVRAALPGKRSIVLTRSTFLGVGNWAAHWLGDNYSSWTNLYYSIIGILQFNTFGVPFVGADICGFGGETTEELCTRWQQLGAFYPFSRNHNAVGGIEQDPGVWGELSRNSTRTALEIRYTLLPYLYYLFYVHRTQGDTVARPLFHEYPTDSTALGIDKQFLWGSGFLITPVLEEGATSVEAYFPQGRWYNYYDGKEVSNGMVTLDAPLGFINLHVHGGNILPTQDPALNTGLSRQNPFGLIIALNGDQTATGGMYYDDGDSLEPQDSGTYFSSYLAMANGVLHQNVLRNGYSGISDKVIGSIRLLGAQKEITRIRVNGIAHTDFTNLPSGEVKVNNLKVLVNSNFSITFD